MPPLSPSKQLVMQARAGVPDLEIWNTGMRGEPFSVQTIVEATNVAVARQLIRQYEKEKGKQLAIMFAGSPEEFKVTVLNVRPIPGQVAAVLIGIGGVSGGTNYAICGAQWDLVARIEQEA